MTSPVLLPLPLLLETMDVLAFRRDAVRAELLLRLAAANQSALRLTPADAGTRSDPVHAPLNKLTSFAVSGLIRAGANDAAFQLWLRATSDGYLNCRPNIEKLLQRGATPPKAVVPR